MNVKVRVEKDIRDQGTASETNIPIKDQETVDTLLIKLSKRYPDLVESILDPRTGEINEDYNIKLNGRPIDRIKGLHTTLKDRDEISISGQNSG